VFEARPQMRIEQIR